MSQEELDVYARKLRRLSLAELRDHYRVMDYRRPPEYRQCVPVITLELALAEVLSDLSSKRLADWMLRADVNDLASAVNRLEFHREPGHEVGVAMFQKAISKRVSLTNGLRGMVEIPTQREG